MYRVSRSSNVGVLPAVPAGEGAGGYFTPGDPGTGVPATVPGHEWFNRVQEELVAVIDGAGLVLDAADNTQLRAAITSMISGASKAVIIQNAVFEASVVDGETVYWDAGNARFDEALADGSATNLAVGIADVTNAEVVCFGETRAGLLGGLTPGAKYFLDGAVAGGLNTVAPADRVTLGIAKAADIIFVDIDNDSGGLQKDVSETLKAGFPTDEYDKEVVAGGTWTVSLNVEHVQKAVNGGAFILEPPAGEYGDADLYITNNGAAGVITTNGFTKKIGDDFTTTPGDKFMCQVKRSSEYSVLSILALQ